MRDGLVVRKNGNSWSLDDQQKGDPSDLLATRVLTQLLSSDRDHEGGTRNRGSFFGRLVVGGTPVRPLTARSQLDLSRVIVRDRLSWLGQSIVSLTFNSFDADGSRLSFVLDVVADDGSETEVDVEV